MEDLRLLSTSSTVLKPVRSPLTGSLGSNKQRVDSSLIQQSDISSSRPALLADDILGPLLFEALDGFFFTINHNCELDFVSDNVGQYLKFSQEELAGRNLHHCVHPSDVSEFSKAWAKKDAGDSLSPTTSFEQLNGPSRGRTFLCRMRTNDESSPYLPMIVSVALHRDSSGSDKTFLICIARRQSMSELKEKPNLLGFDQFSSRINLQYDIESLDSSHLKCERIDTDFKGKSFRDYVHAGDIPLISRHFQEVIEKGESKSAIYRFRLHDDVYAFVNTQSKLFSNKTTNSDSIMSTHTIIRLIDNTNDLNGNASTRLMKSIIMSNRDLQRNKQQSSMNKQHHTQSAPPPIGTQFALTMLGMHKNASDSLQQHVSSTLGTLLQVQSSLSTPTTPNDKVQQQMNMPLSPPRTISQKSSTLDSNLDASSSAKVEFGSKRTLFSPSLNSGNSTNGNAASPTGSPFDLLFSSVSPTDDLNSFLPLSSPNNKKPSSPSQISDLTGFFSNNDIYKTTTSPLPTPLSQSRSSTRLRQLLTTKSPPSTANSSPRYVNENKSHSNTFDELTQVAESPTTTRLSPLPNDLVSPVKRSRSHSQTSATSNSAADLLLKQILGRHTPATMASAPNLSDIKTFENNSARSSPSSIPTIKTEGNSSDDSSSISHISSTNTASSKIRSDTFLRTLLNDDVRPQKVVVKTPFEYNSREKLAQRASAGATQLVSNSAKSQANSHGRSTLKSQLSLPLNSLSDTTTWNQKTKRKQRQHSHSFGSRQNSSTALQPRKPGRPRRDPSDYLLINPQSTSSDNSLDSLYEPSANIERSSPNSFRRTTRQSSSSNTNITINLKRPIEIDDQLQHPKKYSKIHAQLLKDDIKVESQDHSIISPSAAIAATRALNQPSQTMIKTEPDIYEHSVMLDRTPSPSLKRSSNFSTPTNGQSRVRSIMCSPQTSFLTSKKDAPLYDLLQNIDTNDPATLTRANSASSSTVATNTNVTTTTSANNNSKMNPVDHFEQYLNPVLPQSTSVKTTTTTKPSSSKDDYLAALLSSDPQQPNEISFTPLNKQQTPQLTRSASTSSDSSRIAAIVNDFLNSTSTAPIVNNSSDDILSLLDNRDFLECLNDPTTIDSILAQNSTNTSEAPFSSSTSKRSEKDEKAISEIYNTLVTSFNPGSSSIDLLVDNSPFSSITGDLFLAENPVMPVPSNRTVTADSPVTMYRQQPTSFSYQTPQKQQQQSSTPVNTSQFTNCLSMDIIDTNAFPPNRSLSPMNNAYSSSSASSNAIGQQYQHMENNPMMMYSQQTPTHIQHHQPQNQMSNMYYRQTAQNPQQTLYSGFVPQTPSSQMAPNYYSMQQQPPPQQRMHATNPSAQMNKRASLMQHQRTPQQPNPQLQVHMSMNVSMPHITPNQLPQQQLQHRPMMNTYNELMMTNSNGPILQQDSHQISPSLLNNSPLDLPYKQDLFMSSSPSGPLQLPPLPPAQQQQHITHMNVMQSPQQQTVPSFSSATLHQPYSNMSVALSATIQQNSHNSNNLVNSSMSNLTPAECCESEELNNQMMSCLSFPPSRYTKEYVRKQLQNTIQGRQKPTGGKDMSVITTQKMMGTSNLDSNQKGSFFRSQLSPQISTSPLPTTIRSQQPQQQ